jgi:hypothetical protein
MTNITTDKLTATVSAQVSSIDGITYDFQQQVAASAHLGTMAELVLKLFNRLTVPSATLVSGGSAGSVALAFQTGGGPISGIEGLYQGVPFLISGAGTISAECTSAFSTTSMQIRRVLVGLSLGDISAVTSSIASSVGTLTFVVGSAMTVSVANAASDGGVSAWFNQVPLPKHSAGLVPVGAINVPNSATGASAGGISNTCLTFNLREIYGVDLSAIIGSPVQP